MSPGFGIYIHVPFCSRKCDYCAFATWSDRSDLVDEYLRALGREITVAAGSQPAVQTVFIGGGSPSLVPPEALMEVCASLRLAPGYEFTVECNPEQVTEKHIQVYQDGGVNRISMGAQSLDPAVLRSLGREHDPDQVARASRFVRDSDIPALNLDLIYGAAGEQLHQWEATLRSALELSPDHISAYALTVEAGTPLADDPARHPDDDDQADKYVMADELLSGAGLANYEVSNWSRPGFESQHNRLYWAQGNYRGFGCAAHSHDDGHRWWNVRTPERYIKAIREGSSPVAGSEDLDAETRRVEGLQLAVRTREGVEAGVIPEEVRHLVEISQGRARLTRQGRLLANEVAVRLE
ncbi:MAG: radical SAM family heme chaperone HemW [Acidimicrobiales bacterium]